MVVGAHGLVPIGAALLWPLLAGLSLVAPIYRVAVSSSP